MTVVLAVAKPAMFMLFGAEVASEYPRLTSEPTEQPALEGLKEPLPQLVWGKVRALFITDGKRETPVVETPPPEGTPLPGSVTNPSVRPPETLSRREKKKRLIEKLNPHWHDLAEDWFPELQAKKKLKK